MSYSNYDDVVGQLISAGLMPDSAKKSQGGISFGQLYVESTRPVRCDVSGESKKQSGAYWLHELRLDDGVWITGAYWLDHGNTSYKIELRKTCAKCHADLPLKTRECPACGHGKSVSRQIPKEQLDAHKKRMAEARKQAEADRQRNAEAAASWAGAVWRACREVQPGEHDYLTRKQLTGTGAVRIFESNEGVQLVGDQEDVAAAYKYLATFHGALVVPTCDHNGKVYGLQFILSREKHQAYIAKHNRDKTYWPSGMAVEGHYWMIGRTPTRICLTAEGYATAMSLHEATGHPVAVAFAANNIGPVNAALRKRYGKRINFLNCADDDWLQRCNPKQDGCGKYTPVAEINCKHCGKPHGNKNPGVEAASNAALANAGAWVKPEFQTARPDDKKGATDFNDLHCIDGLQIVRAQIEQKVADLGWVAVPPSLVASSPRAGISTQGGGERQALKSMIPIDEAQQRFALIYGGNGSMFDFQEHILVPKSDVLDILPEHGWRDLRAVKRVVRMDEVGFDPAETDPRIVCNLWGGWPTTPKRGSCERLLELLEYLCSEEENYKAAFEWVLKWVAYPIQHPGAKMRTALVFHGPQGTGKNLFFETVMQIYGEYGRIVDQSAVEDKFNDWASKKLFMIADEVVARQELFHVKNKLKGFVTGEWIRINPKNVAAHDERNHVNLVFLSNESQPLVLEKDDRRYAVIHTPEKLDPEFYQAVREELNNGGIAALHDYLLRVELGDFDEHTKPPMTRAKRDLIEYGMDSVQQFTEEWLSERLGLPVCPCGSSELYSAYVIFCRINGENSCRNAKQFVGTIRHQRGFTYGEETWTVGIKQTKRGAIIPPPEILQRKSIEFAIGAETRSAWMTRHCKEFSDALELMK